MRPHARSIAGERGAVPAVRREQPGRAVDLRSPRRPAGLSRARPSARSGAARRRRCCHGGVDFLATLHPDDRERVAAALPDVLAGKRVDVTYRVLRPDGGVRWVRDSGFPIRTTAARSSAPAASAATSPTGSDRGGARAQPARPRADAAGDQSSREEQPPGDHQPAAAAGRPQRQRGDARRVRGGVRAGQHDHRAARRRCSMARRSARSISAPTCTSSAAAWKPRSLARGSAAPCGFEVEAEAGAGRPRPRRAAGPDRQRAGDQRREARLHRHAAARSRWASTAWTASIGCSVRDDGPGSRHRRPGRAGAGPRPAADRRLRAAHQGPASASSGEDGFAVVVRSSRPAAPRRHRATGARPPAAGRRPPATVASPRPVPMLGSARNEDHHPTIPQEQGLGDREARGERAWPLISTST